MKCVTMLANAEVHLLVFEHAQNWIPWLWTAETALHQFDWLVSTLFHTCQRRNVSHKNLDLQHKNEKLDNLLNKASHAGMETKNIFSSYGIFKTSYKGCNLLQPLTILDFHLFIPIIIKTTMCQGMPTHLKQSNKEISPWPWSMEMNLGQMY